VIGKQRGLGDYDDSAIEIVGDLSPVPNFKVPPQVEKAGELTTGEGEFFLDRIRLRPKADETLCTGCGTCIEQCPVSALSMRDNVPEVDPERCIACFCCQEICPETAIKLG
jgi:ferredoxin